MAGDKKVGFKVGQLPETTISIGFIGLSTKY